MVPAAMAAQFGGPVGPGPLPSACAQPNTATSSRGGEGSRGPEGVCGGLPTGPRARPAGFVEPGRIYTPLNDTFAGDSGPIPVYQGELQTRWNAGKGRMEFLVEAHIGTNLADPDYNLGTMYARVVVYDAGGAYTYYQYNSPTVSDGHQYCYSNATGFADGYVTMWIPLPLAEPGFTVRTEIRSNNTIGGPWYCALGNDCVLGNSEAYVHIGAQPQDQLNSKVIGAVGVALDSGVIVDPSSGDEGPDDVESIVTKWSQTFLPQAIAAIPPSTSDPDSNFFATTVSHVQSIAAPGARISSIKLVPKPLSPLSFDDEHVLRVTIPSTPVRLQMSAEIRSGLWNNQPLTCAIDATVPVSFEADLQIDINSGNAGVLDLGVDAIRFDVGDVSADISGFIVSFPGIPLVRCDGFLVRPKIVEGIEKKLPEMLTAFANDPSKILDKIEPFLAAVDLSKGPLVSAGIGNSGVSIGSGNFRHTCIPAGCDGGDVLMWSDGIDIGADLAVGDAKAPGDPRTFPSSYSVVPTGIEQVLHGRQRPDGTSFDLAAYVHGSTVNQMLRSLAEGGPGGGGIFDVGGPGVAVRPTVAPMYLPDAPAGFGVGGSVKLFAPGLELAASFANYRTESVDLRGGLDASIDPGTYTLEATADAAVAVRGLQLDKPGGINWTLDLSFVVPPDILGWLQHDLPTSLANGLLQPLKLNAIEALFSMPLLQGSELGKVQVGSKDGYLGVWVDVDASPVGGLSVHPVFGNGYFHPPTKFTFTATPDYFPGSGPYSVSWTIVDYLPLADPVVYESPPAGEPSLVKEFAGNEFGYTSDSPHEYHLGVAVTISRGGRSVTTQQLLEFEWESHP